MGDVSNSIRNDMLNAAVNGMYRSAGTNNIKASAAAERVLERDGRKGISDKEMKVGLEQDRVVLSLKNGNNEGGRYWDARAVAREVATKLDRADGREDGYIDLKKGPDSLFDRISGIFFGNLSKGILKSDMVDKLASGDLVIGRQIRTRESAKQRGFTMVEFHTNKDGFKITQGQ